MRKMKDSGIEWIGEIPEDWECFYLSQIFSPVKNRNIGLTEKNLLSLSYGKIVRKNIETTFGLLPENFEGYNIIQENDIVLRLTDLQNDHKSLRVGLATEKGIITSAYLTLRNQTIKIAKYFYYLLHSFDIAKGFYGMGAGVRQGLNWNEVRSLRIIAPKNVSEQQRIADFLDDKVSQIDSTISKTRESIEEYKKLKQSIISEAVTKGLNPDAKMKDSGIEWIGEIPEDWEVKRTKFIADSMHKGNGITKEQIVQDGDSPCVRYGEIYSKYNISFSECKTRTNKSFYATLQYFSFGDILFACTGELPEEIGKNIVYLGNEKCLAGGDIIILSHSQEPRFLSYVYNSYGQTQKSCGKTKLKVVHISAPEIANIVVALPPISEQKQIADYLDQKCSEIDSLVTKKEQLVVELESYKKSLVYEVVTGKRAV